MFSVNFYLQQKNIRKFIECVRKNVYIKLRLPIPFSKRLEKLTIKVYILTSFLFSVFLTVFSHNKFYLQVFHYSIDKRKE